MSKNKTRTKDKYRVVYNDTQRIELENEFRVSEYISIPRKQEIAHKLKLSERQIKIWFQNRRAKKRKQDKRKLSDKISLKTSTSGAGSVVKLEKNSQTTGRRPTQETTRQISPSYHPSPTATTTTTINNNNNNNNNHITSNSTLNHSHYSNCTQQPQLHQQLLQPTLLEDSLSPPNSSSTNSHNIVVKLQPSSDDIGGYQQGQHMSCLGSSPAHTVARSLPDIANLRVSTSSSSSSSTTLPPSYHRDHQLATSGAAPAPASGGGGGDAYTNPYDYANANILHSSNSPNYCSDNNNAPQLDSVSCQQSNNTSAADYNNYPPPPPTLHNMHQPNHSTTNNYYPTHANHHHHQHFSTTNTTTTNQLGSNMNRANSTTIPVHQQSNKLPNCELDDFLAEPRVTSNGVTAARTTEPCYELTRPFGYDTYGTRTPLSQYTEIGAAGNGPQWKLRSNSYNNLGNINNHHQAPAGQLYTQQPQPTGDHMFVSRQQFYY